MRCTDPMNDSTNIVTPMPSVRTLLEGAIDYASLFPPSQYTMERAVNNYALNRSGVYGWMMGRFVLPVARLDEFLDAANQYLTGPTRSPWRLSVLSSEDAYDSIKSIMAFNRDNSGKVVIDSFEVKGNTTSKIENTVDALPDFITAYFELPPAAANFPDLVATLAINKQCAKIRTGGVTADAFPKSKEVIRFVRTCMAANVPFKATAGLHHPIRCFKPLTYDDNAPSGTMHGFLNVFLMTGFARESYKPELLEEILEEEFAEAFTFDPESITWRDENHLELWQIERLRRFGIHSFGSCSFEEPMEDLIELGLL
jgi:hypothetical protein